MRMDAAATPIARPLQLHPTVAAAGAVPALLALAHAACGASPGFSRVRLHRAAQLQLFVVGVDRLQKQVNVNNAADGHRFVVAIGCKPNAYP